jgi:hypothetical protein
MCSVARDAWFAVDEILEQFEGWKQGTRVVCSEKESNVFVDCSYERNTKRCPHFAIFGSDRLTTGGRQLFDKSKTLNPHVIFHFCWGNNIHKEKLAVDDMINFAGLGQYSGLGKSNVA